MSSIDMTNDELTQGRSELWRSICVWLCVVASSSVGRAHCHWGVWQGDQALSSPPVSWGPGSCLNHICVWHYVPEQWMFTGWPLRTYFLEGLLFSPDSRSAQMGTIWTWFLEQHHPVGLRAPPRGEWDCSPPHIPKSLLGRCDDANRERVMFVMTPSVKFAFDLRELSWPPSSLRPIHMS